MLGMLYHVTDALRRRSVEDDHGRVGEDLAHRYLRRHGCTVVARNYRTQSGSGEIDIIAWHGTTLVFVEVKTRSRTDFGLPEDAVDAEKRSRLQRAGRDYARRTKVDWRRTRFDIVSVYLGEMNRWNRMEWIRGAFSREADPWAGDSVSGEND